MYMRISVKETERMGRKGEEERGMEADHSGGLSCSPEGKEGRKEGTRLKNCTQIEGKVSAFLLLLADVHICRFQSAMRPVTSCHM
jgi:hypothetical protein